MAIKSLSCGKGNGAENCGFGRNGNLNTCKSFGYGFFKKRNVCLVLELAACFGVELVNKITYLLFIVCQNAVELVAFGFCGI
jgi:hypothetical protein